MDIRQIGRDLGVGAVLEGSVRRAGSRLRVTAQLTNTVDGYHLWSERYDREMADVFDIQDEIVESIVTALAPTLLGEAKAAVRRATENLEAYKLYLKGRHYWNQRSPAVAGTAIRCFEEAIALDPQYALAYAGLADCYSILRTYGWTTSEHSRPLALDAVRHALALDPRLAEAHFSQALYTFHFEHHWRKAARHFGDALALNPRMALAHAYFGVFLAGEYRFAEARAQLATAHDLDRDSPLMWFLSAAVGCLTSDYEGAERSARRALDLQPDAIAALWPLAIALCAAGRADEATAAAQRVIAVSRAPIYVGILGMTSAFAGRTDEARRLLGELQERRDRGEYIAPFAMLSIYLGLKDDVGVRAALLACVDGGAAPLSVMATARPFLDAMRSDPEIDALLDRLYDGARPAAG